MWGFVCPTSGEEKTNLSGLVVVPCLEHLAGDLVCV